MGRRLLLALLLFPIFVCGVVNVKKFVFLVPTLVCAQFPLERAFHLVVGIQDKCSTAEVAGQPVEQTGTSLFLASARDTVQPVPVCAIPFTQRRKKTVMSFFMFFCDLFLLPLDCLFVAHKARELKTKVRK